MPDTKRPQPADEGALTRRWRPGEDPSATETAEIPAASDTVEMPVLAPPDSRRSTLSMGAVKADSATLPPPTVHMAPEPIPHEAGAGVELVVVEEPMITGGEKRSWRAAEVWTKRRVYGLDSTFKCSEIIDRETGLPERGHEMLGARLGGGRQRDKDNKVRFSYPLPLPGMEAMFMKETKHGYTSPVERMVVRVRVLVTSADEAPPTWDDIATRWSEPPPAKK
jgi:hypothetical protein